MKLGGKHDWRLDKKKHDMYTLHQAIYMYVDNLDNIHISKIELFLKAFKNYQYCILNNSKH